MRDFATLFKLALEPVAHASFDSALKRGVNLDANSFELRWQCEGVEQSSGATLLPAGPIYFSATVAIDAQASRVAALTSGRVQRESDAALSFETGDVLVNEYAGPLGMATGLTELNVVGSFEARAAQPQPRDAGPSR